MSEEFPSEPGDVKLPRELPVLPLKSTVVFPRIFIPLSVGRRRSLKLLDDLPPGDRFIAVYLKDARSLVKLFKPDGSPDGEIALPGIGSAGGFTGKRKERARALQVRILTIAS